MNECRPPDGTPDGTVCWLYHDRPDGQREWCALRWVVYLFGGITSGGWAGIYDVASGRADRFGWRFHSIATPPEGEG